MNAEVRFPPKLTAMTGAVKSPRMTPQSPAPFSIRPYHSGDAAQLSELYFESARTLGARRYTSEQVAAWAPAPVDPAVVDARASDGRLTLVAEDEQGVLLAYGDLECDGHIDHLYCRSKAAGTGVASAVLEALMASARSRQTDRLYVEASELARGLFVRAGFTIIEQRDFKVRGVPIHNYAMERLLTSLPLGQIPAQNGPSKGPPFAA